MNKLNLTNLLVGIIVILLAITTEKTFMTPVLLVLGSINLFIGINGVEFIRKKLNK